VGGLLVSGVVTPIPLGAASAWRSAAAAAWTWESAVPLADVAAGLTVAVELDELEHPAAAAMTAAAAMAPSTRGLMILLAVFRRTMPSFGLGTYLFVTGRIGASGAAHGSHES
jgi:hypothetical protein